MANANDLQQKMEALNAIPAEQVLEPVIPVDIYLQEAENLAQWCKDDLTELAKGGITEAMVTDIGVRAGALREAQSLWFKDRRTQQQAERDWNTQSPAAYDLRDELLHTFRFAFRKDTNLLNRVSEITAGDGHADMIQDLNDLAVLGRGNTRVLAAIGFDVTKLDEADTLAQTMAELLALANGSKQMGNESKILRDRAYTHLKERVDEVRACGKFVFWKNPDRMKGYISTFVKMKNFKTRSNAAKTEISK